MRGLTVSKQIRVTVNLTALDLELYDGPLASAAAREISQTLELAINTEGSTAESVWKAMHPVIHKWANEGARDTEPIWHIEQVIKEAYRS